MIELQNKLGKQFKIKRINEVWKLCSFKPGIVYLYTIGNVISNANETQLTLEVSEVDLFCEFESGRFEWITADSIDLKEQCMHHYKRYVGFTDTYLYCIKCNEKV